MKKISYVALKYFHPNISTQYHTHTNSPLWRAVANCKVKGSSVHMRPPSLPTTSNSRYSPNHLSSVQFNRSVMTNSLQPHELQPARPPCPLPTPGVHPNPHPLSQCCHPTISSSVIPFFSCLLSFPASGSSQMRQLFASGGQNIGVSALASALPMNTQDFFASEWTGWTSLQSKGLSRVFSNTTVQRHQFFSTPLSFSPTLTCVHHHWKNHSLD